MAGRLFQLNSQRFLQILPPKADDDLAVAAPFNDRGGRAHGSEFGQLISVFRVGSEVALLKLYPFFLQPRCFLFAGRSPRCRVQNNVRIVHRNPSRDLAYQLLERGAIFRGVFGWGVTGSEPRENCHDDGHRD